MTKKPRIYAFVPFDRGAKVRWLLTELGEEFEDRWISGEKKENETAEFLKLNPMGRVPVLETDAGSIFESGAICAYLGDQHIERGVAPALNAPERAEYQQWLYFAVATIDVFQTRIMVIEDIPAGEVQAAKQTALVAEVRDAVHTLDLALAKGQYLVGNRFTVADICVSYHLYWLKLWPELDEVLGKFPRVGAYLDRMKARPSAVKADVFSYKG